MLVTERSVVALLKLCWLPYRRSLYGGAAWWRSCELAEWVTTSMVLFQLLRPLVRMLFSSRSTQRHASGGPSLVTWPCWPCCFSCGSCCTVLATNTCTWGTRCCCCCCWGGWGFLMDGFRVSGTWLHRQRPIRCWGTSMGRLCDPASCLDQHLLFDLFDFYLKIIHYSCYYLIWFLKKSFFILLFDLFDLIFKLINYSYYYFIYLIWFLN